MALPDSLPVMVTVLVLESKGRGGSMEMDATRPEVDTSSFFSASGAMDTTEGKEMAMGSDSTLEKNPSHGLSRPRKPVW